VEWFGGVWWVGVGFLVFVGYPPMNLAPPPPPSAYIHTYFYMCIYMCVYA